MKEDFQTLVSDLQREAFAAGQRVPYTPEPSLKIHPVLDAYAALRARAERAEAALERVKMFRDQWACGEPRTRGWWLVLLDRALAGAVASAERAYCSLSGCCAPLDHHTHGYGECVERRAGNSRRKGERRHGYGFAPDRRTRDRRKAK
jgi:hypothetical protein